MGIQDGLKDEESRKLYALQNGLEITEVGELYVFMMI